MKAVIPIVVLCTLTACSTLHFPGVHRINIQQGNVITQSMIDRLKPGMTKSQVKFVLGTPVIDDPLNQDRWNYVYSIQIAGGKPIQKRLIIHFIDNRLSHFEGDYLPSEEKAVIETAAASNEADASWTALFMNSYLTLRTGGRCGRVAGGPVSIL